MSHLTAKQRQEMCKSLQARWDNAVKFPVGELEVGSIVMVRFKEEWEETFTFLLLFKKNLSEVRLCEMPNDGSFYTSEAGYALKNTEEVVHLVSFSREG